MLLPHAYRMRYFIIKYGRYPLTASILCVFPAYSVRHCTVTNRLFAALADEMGRDSNCNC